MELDTVNKLFLELSQFATATTAKELALQKEIKELQEDMELLEKTSILHWADAKSSKPPTDKRVLLKIEKSKNPVVGYWDGVWWRACTDNVISEYRAPVEEDFGNIDVTHYAYYGGLPK